MGADCDAVSNIARLREGDDSPPCDAATQDVARERFLRARLVDHAHPLTNPEWHAIHRELRGIKARRETRAYAAEKAAPHAEQPQTAPSAVAPPGMLGLAPLLAVQSGVLPPWSISTSEPSTLARSSDAPPIADPESRMQRLYQELREHGADARCHDGDTIESLELRLAAANARAAMAYAERGASEHAIGGDGVQGTSEEVARSELAEKVALAQRGILPATAIWQGRDLDEVRGWAEVGDRWAEMGIAHDAVVNARNAPHPDTTAPTRAVDVNAPVAKRPTPSGVSEARRVPETPRIDAPKPAIEIDLRPPVDAPVVRIDRTPSGTTRSPLLPAPPRNTAGATSTRNAAKPPTPDAPRMVPDKRALVGSERVTYDRVRPRTPSRAIRAQVNAGSEPKSDPVYGFRVEQYEADHIVSLKEILRMKDFVKLTPSAQLEVVNLRVNFVGLGKPTNASKGARSWSEWQGHRKYGPVPDQVRDEMLQRQAIARAAIEAAIKERLPR